MALGLGSWKRELSRSVCACKRPAVTPPDMVPADGATTKPWPPPRLVADGKGRRGFEGQTAIFMGSARRTRPPCGSGGGLYHRGLRRSEGSAPGAAESPAVLLVDSPPPTRSPPTAVCPPRLGRLVADRLLMAGERVAVRGALYIETRGLWGACRRLYRPHAGLDLFVLFSPGVRVCHTLSPWALPVADSPSSEGRRCILVSRLGGGGTQRSTRREERGTVQGPVKKQQPDGMSHRGGRAGHGSALEMRCVGPRTCCAWADARAHTSAQKPSARTHACTHRE